MRTSEQDIKTCMPARSRPAVGLKSTTTGDTLCDEDHPVLLEVMRFSGTGISMAIEPKTKADQENSGSHCLDHFLPILLSKLEKIR